MSLLLLITDLDNTLVGDRRALANLNRGLLALRQQGNLILVYSTGRSPTLYRRLTTEQNLLAPDLLVCAVGTEIYHQGQPSPDAGWAATLSQRWNREQVVAITADFASLIPQPASEQRPFKVSYHVTPQAAAQIVPQLEACLDAAGLDTQVIYSGRIDLDILPRQANKGMAMSFVRQYLNVPVEQTVACGDSGNDLALFAEREEWGIIVGNAMPELLSWHHANPNPKRYLATDHCAGGILEGLQSFGFL